MVTYAFSLDVMFTNSSNLENHVFLFVFFAESIYFCKVSIQGRSNVSLVDDFEVSLCISKS